ncbi:BRCA2-interacting transcriptional repressor EMSY-like [Phlebotomus papatasi]|uniref:BRCA2-interacting transcriptional repressor EMSY-like n=1 Tax=Phlebotomus papatasi TaxID=29031 RepID=UPI002483A79D|nr:BRCA2-interacting transcriptional repressor EMSY-like [Phlebotomus papatasi]
MWPTTVDMTRDECRSRLRHLELDAYSSVVSTFRAQGHLTDKKLGVLKDLQAILHISADRHRCEVRRVAYDEELNTVATKIYGQNTAHEWSKEGRRTFPFFPRDTIHTALMPAADAAAEEGARQNSTLPYPSDTERMHKPLEQTGTVPVVTENELVSKTAARKDVKRSLVSLETSPVAKRRIVQAPLGTKGKEIVEVRREMPDKKNPKRLKNLKWTSPKKSPMSDSEKSNLASRIMHSYASPAPIPATLKRSVSEIKSPIEEGGGGRVQLMPQIATSKKDITTNLTKLSQLGTSGKAVVKKVENPGELLKNWGEEERAPRIPITVQGAVKKVNLTSNSLATLITANGGNIIKKIPSTITNVLQSPGIVKSITPSVITTASGQVVKPKVKIISQQITPAPLTPGTQVKIPAGLHLKTLQGRPDNIKIVTGPSGKMVLKAVNDPAVKAKVAPLKNLQTVVLPPKTTTIASPVTSNNVLKIIKEPPKMFTVEPLENNVVVLDIQPEQGVQEEEGLSYASQITEDTPVDILPASEDVLDARANLRTIRVPKRPQKVVTTDWEEELDTQTNHIRTRHKSGGEEDEVEYTYLPEGIEEDCEQIEEDEVTLEDSSMDMVDDAIVEEDYHENGQEDIEDETEEEHLVQAEDVNGGPTPKISIETLITAGQILESNEIAMREQECSGIK